MENENIISGDMSVVKIDRDKKTVTKTGLDNIYTKTSNGFQREAEWLIRLRVFDRVPKIIEVKYPDILVMSYVGEPITRATVPSDWKDQMEYILKELKEYGCHHNDIKPSEILVSNGLLYLIDYHWATLGDECLPKNTPAGLGCSFKAKGGFNDRFSFYVSVLSVLDGIKATDVVCKYRL